MLSVQTAICVIPGHLELGFGEGFNERSLLEPAIRQYVVQHIPESLVFGQDSCSQLSDFLGQFAGDGGV
jgi:hypothetical protein